MLKNITLFNYIVIFSNENITIPIFEKIRVNY